MAEPVKKPPMMCAVCGQVLDQWLGGWVHTAEFSGMSDHVAVPVEYDESRLVSRCDFCHAAVPLADRWVLPARDFIIPIIGSRSQGGWASCPSCAQLIAENRWDEVADQLGKAPKIREWLKLLYDRLQMNVTGPIRPWQPGDEAVEHQED